MILKHLKTPLKDKKNYEINSNLLNTSKTNEKAYEHHKTTSNLVKAQITIRRAIKQPLNTQKPIQR